MHLISPARVIAACAGLTGFAVALFAGLGANNAADIILGRAVVALFVCYAVGGLVGYAMDFAAGEGIKHYKKTHPLPGEARRPDAETRRAV